jgi:hypothetical protein
MHAQKQHFSSNQWCIKNAEFFADLEILENSFQKGFTETFRGGLKVTLVNFSPIYS